MRSRLSWWLTQSGKSLRNLDPAGGLRACPARAQRASGAFRACASGALSRLAKSSAMPKPEPQHARVVHDPRPWPSRHDRPRRKLMAPSKQAPEGVVESHTDADNQAAREPTCCPVSEIEHCQSHESHQGEHTEETKERLKWDFEANAPSSSVSFCVRHLTRVSLVRSLVSMSVRERGPARSTLSRHGA
jgi:hypothetical protein